MNSVTVICLFVKPPVPGRVKTRLAEAVGHDNACQIYVQLVERILLQIRTGGFPLVLFFAAERVDELPKKWRDQAQCCYPQSGNTLGERMTDAFEQLFCDGYQSVLLCGSDVIDVDADYLKQAAFTLEHNGMVISPALDGGYCLIGMTDEVFNPLVFEEIDWSTPRVLSQTLEQCRRAGLQPELLGQLRDIDTLSDLVDAALSRP